MSTAQLPFSTVEIFTPQILGLVFNWGLLGVLSSQVYIYYLRYPKDSWRIKSLVYGLCIAEVIQTSLLTHDAVIVLGRGWGDITVVTDMHTLWFSGAIMNGTADAIVQLYYAWRIFILSKSIFFTAIIVLVTLTGCGSAIALGIIIKVKLHNSNVGLQDKTLVVTTVNLLGSAVADIIICGYMVYFLTRIKKNTAYRSTEDMVTKLLRLTIGTGFLTMTVAVVEAVLFLVYKDDTYYMCPAAIIGKLYSASLLVLLNSRVSLRTAGSTQTYIWEHEVGSVATASRRGANSELVFVRPGFSAYRPANEHPMSPISGANVDLNVPWDVHVPSDSISMTNLTGKQRERADLRRSSIHDWDDVKRQEMMA